MDRWRGRSSGASGALAALQRLRARRGVGAKATWMQEGVRDAAAAVRAREAGLVVIGISIDRSVWYFAAESERERSLAWRPPIEPTQAAQSPHG